ncbi:MAG: hypothetical protein AAB617_00585 [Patescibacteria group bacterium]
MVATLIALAHFITFLMFPLYLFLRLGNLIGPQNILLSILLGLFLLVISGYFGLVLLTNDYKNYITMKTFETQQKLKARP